MKHLIPSVFIFLAAALPALPQPQPAQPPASPASPTIKTNVDEVLLDLVVRDKKGKPITDLTPDELTITDNGSKQTILSFRQVRGTEAVTATGATEALDPMRQIRLVTLAFEPSDSPTQRKLARDAAIDLVKGDQGTNVFYSVVVIDTKLLLLQQFTKDHDALVKAVEQATQGLSAPRLSSEADAIMANLRTIVNQDSSGTGAVLPQNTLSGATQLAATGGNSTTGPPADPTGAMLARVMLNMLRMDQAAQSNGTRMSLDALKALVDGLRSMPGRKSVMYFSAGMYRGPELDNIWRTLLATANRDNVTFYSVDTRGVMIGSQNTGAMNQLNGANAASANGSMNNQNATQAEMMASDNAEVAGRANVQLAIRDLAESTGGFLIGDSNDLRVPLRRVNEEISSYYEIAYNPGITNFDGSFRKLSVASTRKDLVIHARTGYFALPPEARASGLAPFELPLLKAISDGKLPFDVEFRAGAVELQPKKSGTDVTVMVEVPMHALQATQGAGTLDVHCSFASLVKDSNGQVVDKVTRDRSFKVTEDQHKLGNFLDKTTFNLPPGKYTLDTAVLDEANQKIGVDHADFTVAPANGVGISSLLPIRSGAPSAKGMDPSEPFQFQGATLTPTLDNVVKKVPNAMLRLFFTVYPDAAVSGKPTVEIEFMKDGQTLQKVPMDLPAPDALGRIQQLMTIPAAAIPDGTYDIRATAKQGSTTAVSSTTVKFASE
jgi:VWFA-related protein